MNISPNELVIKGSWISDEISVVSDSVSKRIESLVNEYLIKISTDESGWIILYKDPNDKRYWVLSYPNSDLHGSGPPMLQNISYTDARSKFGNI